MAVGGCRSMLLQGAVANVCRGLLQMAVAGLSGIFLKAIAEMAKPSCCNHERN